MKSSHRGYSPPDARKLQATSSQIYGEEAPLEEKPAAQANPTAPYVSPKPASAVAAVSGQGLPHWPHTSPFYHRLFSLALGRGQGTQCRCLVKAITPLQDEHVTSIMLLQQKLPHNPRRMP